MGHKGYLKGQITLQARDVMMVREGDHLEAVIQDDALC